MQKKFAKFFLKLIVSLGLLTWVIFKVDWNEFFNYVGRIKIWQLAAYLMLVLFGMMISSYKWKILADYKKIKRPYLDYLKFYFTGAFINNFMPSFIGGDTYRAYQIGRADKRYAEAASTVMMDRITGFISATILALVFSIINFKAVLGSKILILANIAIVFSFLIDILIAKARNISFLRNRLKKIIPEKIVNFIHELHGYDGKSGILRRAVSLGCIFSFVGVALSNYILFLSLGIEISIINYLSVIFLITIVSSIPITVNNIGLKEWAYVTFFGIFGVNTSLVIIAAILSRFLQMMLSFMALPTYLKTKNNAKRIAAAEALSD